MRITYLLFLVLALASSGCAAKIAGLGTDPTKFETIEEVHAKFGQPDAGGTLDGKDGAFYEDYITRRKIATYPLCTSGPGYGIALVMTLGTVDLLMISNELCLSAKRTLTGQTLRFIYDNNGKLIKLQLDGEADEFFWFNLRNRATQNTGPLIPSPQP